MIEDELSATPLFAAIGRATVAALQLGVVEVQAGQILAQAGEHGSGMYVVLDGAVIVDLHDGEAAIGPGGFFGELSLLVPGAERVARVRATTDTRLVALSRASFDHLLESEPSFALALLRELAERLVEARRGSEQKLDSAP